LTTTAGDLELRIPKLRAGSFFPSLLERRRRVDRALFAVVMGAYLHGVSTRKVDDLVKALGAGTGISKSEVSRICADLDVEVVPDRSLADQRGFELDALLLHDPPQQALASEEVWSFLVRLRHEGLTRRVGVSTTPAKVPLALEKGAEVIQIPVFKGQRMPGLQDFRT